jgi:predicted membrane channel-forming protein YqfA (hemolysin III family)
MLASSTSAACVLMPCCCGVLSCLLLLPATLLCCVMLCSPTGSAHQVLSSLSVALPWQAYLSLQKQLMAKGLIRELEVPAEFL